MGEQASNEPLAPGGDRVANIFDSSLGYGQVIDLMRDFYSGVSIAIERKSIAPFMRSVYSSFGKAVAAAPRANIACFPGCSHCCHIWVEATAAEILYAVKGIGRRTSEAITRSLALPLTVSDTFAERAKIVAPCPALMHELCSLYNRRPLSCRAAVSADPIACLGAFRYLSGGDIPTPVPHILAKTAHHIALSGALKHAGLSYLPYELNSGLRVALGTADAEQRWLAGEDIFEGAQAQYSSDPFLIPRNAQIYTAAFG